MMEIKTLENFSTVQITNLLNAAFADYFVKIELSPEQMSEKIISEDIKLNYSTGVFVENKAVGFILHAVRKVNNVTFAYNAGTGVIPEYRGQKATTKMYNFILPVLKQKGVKQVELEVMEQNTPAIKSYQNAGFRKTKNLECFKGTPAVKNKLPGLSFSEINFSEITTFEKYWDWQPSWQNSSETIIKTNSYKAVLAEINNGFAAYVVFKPTTGRVAQFAVKQAERKKKIATSLFNFIAQEYQNELTLINIDGNTTETILFLKSIGMHHFLTQHKMEIQF